MKVLLLSIFHPELVRGGAQQVCYELFEGLKEVPDVQPVLLAAVDQTFGPLYKAGARITGFDGRDNEFIFLGRDYDYTWHKTSNPQLVDSFAEFLTWVNPDVVHFHHYLLFGVNLIPLVRRILPKAKIVFTLHEFISICAHNGQFVRTTDGSLCNRATPIRCHQCYPDRGPEHFFVRQQWLQRNLESVDTFTTPSRFMIDFYTDWGIDRERITHVTNGQTDQAANAVERSEPREKRNRFGFFGQFVDAKGVFLLLEAVNLLRAEGFTDFSVELNGGNLQYASPGRRAEIETILAQEAARPSFDRLVTHNGSYQVDQLHHRMSRVDWCIVPSIWYETFALVISEAWMFKRPVICANVGAMAERVTDGKDGLLFNLADPRSLADTIRRACLEPDLWSTLVEGITPPPSRDTMVNGFLEVYGAASC